MDPENWKKIEEKYKEQQERNKHTARYQSMLIKIWQERKRRMEEEKEKQKSSASTQEHQPDDKQNYTNYSQCNGTVEQQWTPLHPSFSVGFDHIGCVRRSIGWCSI